MAKPFLDSTGKRVIASGGVVRIANGCEIRNGRLVKVRLPNEFLARAQTLHLSRLPFGPHRLSRLDKQYV